MSKFITIIDNEHIEISDYREPNAVFHTREYADYESLCIFKEVINPFELYAYCKGYKRKIKQYEDIIEINHKIIDTLNEKIKKKENELEDTKINLKNVYAWLKDSHRKIERLENIIKEVREIFKDYGKKEDIVGYTMYNITGEMLITLLEILDKEVIKSE